MASRKSHAHPIGLFGPRHRDRARCGAAQGLFAAAVVSLGLAIGAGVAGFGVLDAVRFRALPFPDATGSS